MNSENWFKEKLDKFKDDIDFLAEKVILDLTEQIVAHMKENNIKRAEFAKRLGVSKAFVTKLLNGHSNLNIKTMVSVAKTLDCELNIGFGPKTFEVRRFYSAPTKQFDPNTFTENVVLSDKGDGDAIAA